MKKIYLHEIAVINLSKVYFPKNAKKTCKPNNRDLNFDWIKKDYTRKISSIKREILRPNSHLNKKTLLSLLIQLNFDFVSWSDMEVKVIHK